jgi:hypothetical protein
MLTSERSRPVRVRDLLVAALPQLEDRLMEEAIRRDWHRTVGPELGRRSRPGRLKGGVLEITVDSSPALHEMTLRSAELLAALQTRSAPAVASLRFSLGALPARPPAPAAQARPEGRGRLSPEEMRRVEATVAAVADPILAAPLRRLLTKDALARRAAGSSPRRQAPRPADAEVR